MNPPEREQPSEREPRADSPADAAPPSQAPPTPRVPTIRTPRYGGYVGLLALVILVLITINTIVTKPNGATGIAPGAQLPPFAVPLASGTLVGDADTAKHADEGSAGRVAACKERGPQILNICQLYEQGPVLLVLFVNGGSCPDVLNDVQALAPSFAGLRVAAVAIKGGRTEVRKLIAKRGLTYPVGLDSDGALAALYKVATCPQLTFAYPGGEVQSAALLRRPSRAALRARLQALVAGSRARGWTGPAQKSQAR